MWVQTAAAGRPGVGLLACVEPVLTVFAQGHHSHQARASDAVACTAPPQTDSVVVE